ncbi:MAG: hypothetical protein ABIO79_02475, partial [Ferruginibacter sp.]
MKIFTLTIVMLFTCITNFAQTSTNCPSYFKRNNGGCNGQAMLKIYYVSCPLVAPVIDSVYHNGQKLNVSFALPNFLNCILAGGYISYCVNGGNLPTVGAMQIFYHTPGVNFNCTVVEEGTLPVKYLSFDAVVNDKNVLLKWLTTQEVNNSHFEVERSFDMNNYSSLGIVLDGFVNGANKSYQFKDNSSSLQGRSIVYYRLKQFDIDGKFTYSKTLVVRLQPTTDVLMQVSPNPFIENLNVRFTSTETGIA